MKLYSIELSCTKTEWKRDYERLIQERNVLSARLDEVESALDRYAVLKNLLAVGFVQFRKESGDKDERSENL